MSALELCLRVAIGIVAFVTFIVIVVRAIIDEQRRLFTEDRMTFERHDSINKSK